jgi:hypothetical protein
VEIKKKISCIDGHKNSVRRTGTVFSRTTKNVRVRACPGLSGKPVRPNFDLFVNISRASFIKKIAISLLKILLHVFIQHLI